MKGLERGDALRSASAVAVYDLLLAHFGPLLAAEGFRRWLAAHADADADADAGPGRVG